MKRKMMFMLLAVAAISIPFIGCEDDTLSENESTAIRASVETMYPGARIVEIERNKSTIEVDIIHDMISKEVLFSLNNNWISTSWDQDIASLPQTVKDIVNNPQYAGYHIDDADFVETPQGNYYLLELEKGNSERKVKVDAAGNILS